MFTAAIMLGLARGAKDAVVTTCPRQRYSYISVASYVVSETRGASFCMLDERRVAVRGEISQSVVVRDYDDCGSRRRRRGRMISIGRW